MDVATRRVSAIAILLIFSLFPLHLASASHGLIPEQETDGTHNLEIGPGENIVIPFTARAGTYWIEASCSGDCRELEMTLVDSNGNQHNATITDTALLRGQMPAGHADLNMLNTGEVELNVGIQSSLPVTDSITELDATSSFDDSTAISFANSESITSIFNSNDPEDGFADSKASWVNASMSDAGTLYWPFEASMGDVIELALLHSSQEISLRIVNNDSEHSTIAEIITNSNTSVESAPQRVWLNPEEGRHWLIASSSHNNLSFSARIAHHNIDDDHDGTDWPESGQMTDVQNIDDSIRFAGALGMNDRDIVTLNASGHDLWFVNVFSTTPVEANITAMIDGIWVPFREFQTIKEGDYSNYSFSFWSKESTALFRFTFSSDEAIIWGVEVHRTIFPDLDSEDAIGSVPWNQTTALEYWSSVEMGEGIVHSGWLCLPIYDGADTFLFKLEGWEGSQFHVRVKLFADDTQVSAEIIEMNWSDRSIVSNSTTNSAGGDVSETTLVVGPGLHLIRIHSIAIADGNADWSWGEVNVSSVEWSFEVESIQTEEGEEPWFEAKGFVTEISEMLLLFFGFLLLVPMIIVLWNRRIYTQRAKMLAGSKERLTILRELLSRGEVKQARGDLKSSLRAIASLEWEEGIKTWGKPDMRHRTENLDMAVWKLPSAISKSEGVPLLLGINVFKGTWEIAAVRFEASSGELWSITHCHPKLLSREDEIFLDTLSEGSRIFVHVELSGSGKGLEVSLSGLVGGEPVAAKHSSSISFEEE